MVWGFPFLVPEARNENPETGNQFPEAPNEKGEAPNHFPEARNETPSVRILVWGFPFLLPEFRIAARGLLGGEGALFAQFWRRLVCYNLRGRLT